MTPYVQWCHYDPVVSCVNTCQGQCTWMECAMLVSHKRVRMHPHSEKHRHRPSAIQPFRWLADIFAVDNSQLEWARERHIMTYQWAVTVHWWHFDALYIALHFSIWSLAWSVLFTIMAACVKLPWQELVKCWYEQKMRVSAAKKVGSILYYKFCLQILLSWLKITCCCMEAR